MKRFYFLIIAFISSFTTYAQGTISLPDKPFVLKINPDSSIEGAINENSAARLLHPEEKSLIYWINYVRQKPKTFNALVLTEFLNQFPEAKSRYSQSLAGELATQASLPPLIPTTLLIKVARIHANDLSQHLNKLTHNSASDLSFEERMKAFKLQQCASENIFYGRRDGLLAIILLLIDTGVENMGHRRNLLNPDTKTIGVAFSPTHVSGQYYLVQDFSCEN